MPSGKISYSDLSSPKEKEGETGIYKGGSSPQGTPPKGA